MPKVDARGSNEWQLRSKDERMGFADRIRRDSFASYLEALHTINQTVSDHLKAHATPSRSLLSLTTVRQNTAAP